MRLHDAGILNIISRDPHDALLDAKTNLESLIAQWNPEILGIEKVYISRNQKTGVGVLEARGVMVATARAHHMTIREYTPSEMKAGITGYGGADKKAVLKMVRIILREPELRVIDDASDAIALAILAAGDLANRV